MSDGNVSALREVVRCLHETGRYVDEEGETTNALADLIGALDSGDAMEAHQANGLAWAVSRWVAEVSNRPLVNVHRRTLDDTWRQVIRYFGGDPVKLIGLDHDTLLSCTGSPCVCGRHGNARATYTEKT